ncbi:adventurous gliding motility protein AgmC [Cystobacter fuscus]|uniref:adventurous gliding motility protein AgmC n=1 Tax=Cystobacter fuscus TaxID=43 RepID=UPI0037C1738C
MKQWLPAAVCALGLGSTTAMAAADTFGLGNGQDGPLTVPAYGHVINSYAQVTAALAAQATSIQIGTCRGGDSACFAEGDLVLVYQATGLQPEPVSGEQRTIDLSNNPVGRWEFARLAAGTITGRLELTEPLIYDYAPNVTQVIRVPEHTKVTIEAGRSITAPAWDGATGGVIAFLATAEVDNRGEINADALGFRGGQYTKGDPADRGCSDLDEATPRGAQKGEGIGTGRYGATQTGRGNVTNGAGGAVCYRSGGGGGGNGGTGGQGGHSEATDGSRPVGGMGGAALSYGNKATSDAYLRRLTFGGGGGAGHGTATTSLGGTGGAGGGIVFLRASQLQGSGSISATGAPGGLNNTSIEGGGGGGAGGTIYVRIVRAAACGQILATGGIGATSSSPRVGPGGGGSAGHVLFQALAGGSCDTDAILATGANPGTQQNPGDGSYGATAGSLKSDDPSPVNELTYGFIIPAPPVVTTPANGSFINNVRPPITGTARPNTPVIVYLDGQEVGRVTTNAAGEYSVTPTQDLAEGPHSVVAIAAIDAVQSLNSVPDTFTVDITPPDTSIASGPGRFTRARDVTFEFGASEEGVTYQCKIDDATDFIPCDPSKTFTGLSDGPHRVEVYAVDRAGNRDDTPTVHEFQITVADLSLLGDGIGGCSASGQDASLIALGLGALVAGLRRRRQSQTH